MKKIAIEKLDALYRAINEKYPLYLPVSDGTETNFAAYKEGANVDLNRLKTVKSPKDLFFPQSEEMMRFEKKEGKWQIFDSAKKRDPFVLFGVRACDYKAFEVLDNVFLNDPKDTYYAHRREAAIIVTLACLKTAVGLITSCGEMFRSMFPKGPSYTVWAVGFCILSFLIATLGLSAIITYSLPVLMFLYPLAITITVVALLGKLYNHDKAVYMATTIMTLIPSVFDFLKALLSDGALNKPEAYTKVCELGERFFPMFDLGLGWVLPSLIGFVIGLAIHIESRLEKKA